MQNLNVTKLAFEEVKDNLKIFLESQSALSDYNFTHDTMNIIMDVIAYGTHYNALYAKQALNETFLDTAILRSSVVSRAKELGYIPRQFTPARTEVTVFITVDPGDLSTEFIIPKYSKFRGEKDGKTIKFITTTQYTLTERTGDVFTGAIQIFQGELVQDKFTFNINDINNMILTPEKVWTDSLEVEVLPFEGSSTKTIFTPIETLVDVTNESAVYFWEEDFDGNVYIAFGDGVIGTALQSGNVVNVNSISTLGSDGNGATSFGAAEVINGVGSNNITIQAKLPSQYGSDRETIESIKLLAPKNYAAQDRLVTPDDYRAYIPRIFGNIESLSVWGGEENDPPIYGRVFISIKPLDSNSLSDFEKTTIESKISNREVVGTQPVFVDPEVINVNVTASINYNNNTTTVTLENAITQVTNAIKDHFKENVNAFRNDLIYSNLLTSIDNSTDAVNGNVVSITLDKSFVPKEGPSAYVFKFVNEIEEGSFISNTWTDTFNDFYIKEREEGGIIDLFRDGFILRSNVGTVDSVNGIINLVNFDPSIPANTAITITVTPKNLNIRSIRNNILVLKNVNVGIS